MKAAIATVILVFIYATFAGDTNEHAICLWNHEYVQYYNAICNYVHTQRYYEAVTLLIQAAKFTDEGEDGKSDAEIYSHMFKDLEHGHHHHIRTCSFIIHKYYSTYYLYQDRKCCNTLIELLKYLIPSTYLQTYNFEHGHHDSQHIFTTLSPTDWFGDGTTPTPPPTTTKTTNVHHGVSTDTHTQKQTTPIHTSPTSHQDTTHQDTTHLVTTHQYTTHKETTIKQTTPTQTSTTPPATTQQPSTTNVHASLTPTKHTSPTSHQDTTHQDTTHLVTTHHTTRKETTFKQTTPTQTSTTSPATAQQPSTTNDHASLTSGTTGHDSTQSTVYQQTTTSGPTSNSVTCMHCTWNYCSAGHVIPMQCNPGEQCMTSVTDGPGMRIVTKTCGTRGACYQKWWIGTSDRTECIQIDALGPPTYNKECTFCCDSDLCNNTPNLMPSKPSQFTGAGPGSPIIG